MRFAVQITLRDVLVLMAILGVSLGLAVNFHRRPETYPEIVAPSRVPQGAMEGVLTGAGLLAFFIAVRWRTKSWRRTRTTLLTLLGLVCIWFAAVDLSRHIEWCQRCHRLVDEFSIRVYRLPLYKMRREVTDHYLSLIVADLGVPCTHRVVGREQWIRVWGFVVAYPCVGGTLSLSGGPPYEEIRPYVIAMGRENPMLGDEFNRHAIEEDDHAYIRKFMAEVWARRDAAEDADPATTESGTDP